MTRRNLAVAGAALITIVLLVALAVNWSGGSLSEVARAAFDGAFGSRFAFFSATLKRAAPLVILGTAAAYSFRAGVLNIGGDGQFLAGASVATAIALTCSTGVASVDIPALLLGGALGGAAWGGVAALLHRRFGVLQVVSTLILNFVASNAISWLVRGPLQEPTHVFPQSATLPASAHLPFIIPGERLHAGFALGIVFIIASSWVVRRTAAGFRLRAAGANPAAAASAGLIDIAQVQGHALIVSGALAGIAGAAEVGGTTFVLYEGISPGYGYTGVAIAVLAGLSPVRMLVTAVAFGALGAAADSVQRAAAVPSEMATVIAGVAVLAIVIARASAARAPARDA